MNLFYENVCRREKMDNGHVKHIRNATDHGRKNLEYEKKQMEKESIKYTSLSEFEDCNGNEDVRALRVPDMIVDVEEMAINNYMIEVLKNSYSVLSPDEYEVIYLYYYEDISWRDIAKHQGISLFALQKKRDRAYEKLRKEMEEWR